MDGKKAKQSWVGDKDCQQTKKIIILVRMVKPCNLAQFQIGLSLPRKAFKHAACQIFAKQQFYAASATSTNRLWEAGWGIGLPSACKSSK